MLLGLNAGAWLFWACVLMLLFNISWAVCLRRVPWATAVGIVTSATAIGLLWLMQGPCVLPQPATVEFQQGMTICPGQNARIRMPVPSSDRAL